MIASAFGFGFGFVGNVGLGVISVGDGPALLHQALIEVHLADIAGAEHAFVAIPAVAFANDFFPLCELE